MQQHEKSLAWCTAATNIRRGLGGCLCGVEGQRRLGSAWLVVVATERGIGKTSEMPWQGVGDGCLVGAWPALLATDTSSTEGVSLGRGFLWRGFATRGQNLEQRLPKRRTSRHG